jgi:hypothetical protein
MVLLVCTAMPVAGASAAEDSRKLAPDYSLFVEFMSEDGRTMGGYSPPTDYFTAPASPCDASPPIAVKVNGIKRRNYNFTQLLVNGRNEIVVEREKDFCDRRRHRLSVALYADGGEYARVEKLHEVVWPAESSVVSFAIELAGIPEWSWQRAERWDGDRSQIVAALRDMRGALIKNDAGALVRFSEAVIKDEGLIAITCGGCFTPDDGDWNPYIWMHGIAEMEEIPPVLSFSTYFDNRLVLVQDALGRSPLRYRSGDEVSSGGIMMSKIDGRWQAIGDLLW